MSTADVNTNSTLANASTTNMFRCVLVSKVKHSSGMISKKTVTKCLLMFLWLIKMAFEHLKVVAIVFLFVGLFAQKKQEIFGS